MLNFSLGVGLLAGLGAVCRYLLDSWINSRTSCSIPHSTWIINTLACFLGGLLAATFAQGSLDTSYSLYLSTGFLGGFSTFSTAMVEVARLYEDKRYVQLFVLGLGMVITCTLAFFAGWLILA